MSAKPLPTLPSSTAAEQPHAVDAERAILGALLMDNDLFLAIDGMLRSDFFYAPQHRTLFHFMSALYQNGHVDPIVLTTHLHDNDKLSEVGGKNYIAEIASIGAAPVNMSAYIKLIRDSALARRMIQALNDGLNAGFHPNGKAPMQLLDETTARLSEVGEVFTREYGSAKEINDLSKNYVRKITDIVRNKNFAALQGFSSGFRWLDQMTTGLHGGDLIILAGRPGAGKTAFGLNLVQHISALPSTGVICFSLEMSAEQLTMRMLAHGGVDMNKLRTGRDLDADDLTKLADNGSRLEERSIYIDDSGLLNILEARTRARRLKQEMKRHGIKLGLIFIDYLQLMEAATDGRNESRALEVATISRGLKSLAKELNVPVLAAAQLNRGVEMRPDQEPRLSDLRESGAIEQDADLILFLQNKEKNNEPNKASKKRAKVQLIIGKQRNGPVGFKDMYFDRHYSVFLEIDEHADYYDGMPPNA